MGKYTMMYFFKGSERPGVPDGLMVQAALYRVTEEGYHPTGAAPEISWHQDLLADCWCAQVVVDVTENEERK